jgi:two-component system, OmpR family, heavy metal sensor histidine kinase CusS
MSLAVRVNLFIALAIALCLAVLHAVIVHSINRHFAEQDADQLVAAVDAAQRVILHYEDNPGELPAALARAVPKQHGLVLRVTGLQGQMIYATAGPEAGEFREAVMPVDSISPASLSTWRVGESVFRGASVRANAGSRELMITAAVDMAFHDDFMARFRRALWGIMAGAGALTLGVAWLAVRQGLAPLHALSREIRTIRSDRLQTRLDPAVVPAELEEMVQAFNHMIGQLEEGFTRLSHFSADIAHELRTPLTNLTTQTQVALGTVRSAAEYRELLYSNLEELDRLAKMVSDMLWLAQSDRGLLVPGSECLELADEVRSLFDYFGALAEDRQVTLEFDGPGASIQGDRSMVRRALANLLSNAIRHTPARGTIRVGVTNGSDGSVTLSVENPGKDIPAEQLGRVFDRFYRIEPARQRHSEGSGLGLAIVKSIVHLHGGEVWAASHAGVTSFTIEFPARVRCEAA